MRKSHCGQGKFQDRRMLETDCWTFLVRFVETGALANIMASLPVMAVLASSNAPSEEEESMAARVETVTSVSLTRLIETSVEDADSGDVFRWE